MRQIKIEAWCDNHFAASEDYVQATVSRTVGLLATGSPKTLDLCDDCDAQLVGPLLQLLVSHGVFYDSKKSPKLPAGKQPAVLPKLPPALGELPTPVLAESESAEEGWKCEICETVITQKGNLVIHIYNRHSTIPLERNRTDCPDCGWKGPTAARSKHRVLEHNYDTLADAYAIARANPKGKLADSKLQLAM